MLHTRTFKFLKGLLTITWVLSAFLIANKASMPLAERAEIAYRDWCFCIVSDDVQALLFILIFGVPFAAITWLFVKLHLALVDFYNR